ncbi:MAG: hypothetical protein GY945_16835 [Rhodobacteraceae bacterium]|nr:hypothetical protein [Paracoccaceae bacterium]
MPHIAALYTGLTALLLAVLSIRISLMRMRIGAAHNDGSDKRLITAIRLQGNLTEYAPMAMLLILLAELLNAPVWGLHAFGIMFLTGRLLHMIGFASRPQNLSMRQAGMVLTYSMLTFAGLTNIAYALF